MKMADFRSLERYIKTISAHDRLDRDEVKGLVIQVIFEESRGAADIPVQVFVAYDDPIYATIYNAVRAKYDAAKAEADVKVNEFTGKLVDSRTLTQ